MHKLTHASGSPFQLKIDMEIANGTTGYATYDNFKIGNKVSQYVELKDDAIEF